MATLEALRRVLHRVDPAGRPVFAPEQLAHLVPFVLLAGADGVRGRALSERVATYLGALGATLGLGAAASGEAIAETAGAYYRRFPVHPALLAAVEEVVSDTGGAPAWDEAARALLVLLEEPEAVAWLPSPDAAERRVSGGPLLQATLAGPPGAPGPRRRRRRGRPGAGG